MEMPALKHVSASALPCKICGNAAPLFSVVDFSKSCEEHHGKRLPLVGIPVYYRRCGTCGFLFTDAFDDWSVDEFRAHIYNDDYPSVDPDYLTKRPKWNADQVTNFWGEIRTTVRVLDFGGGNDALCSALRANGFSTAISYDPIVPEFSRRPAGKFDLVTCFETIEHMPDPMAGIASILEFADDPGLILYSTVALPADTDVGGAGWWYVAPRNGHVSIFTPQALAAAWGHHGYKTVSQNQNIHFAFRTLPPYVNVRGPDVAAA